MVGSKGWWYGLSDLEPILTVEKVEIYNFRWLVVDGFCRSRVWNEVKERNEKIRGYLKLGLPPNSNTGAYVDLKSTIIETQGELESRVFIHVIA